MRFPASFSVLVVVVHEQKKCCANLQEQIMDTLWNTQFPNDTEEFADEFGYRHVERRTDVEGASVLQMQKGMTSANVSRLETMTGTMPQVQKKSEQVSADLFDINFENINEVQQNNAIHIKNQIDKNKKNLICMETCCFLDFRP